MIWHTFDLTKPDHQELYFKASQTADQEARDLVGQEVELWNVFSKVVSKTDLATGEMHEFARIVLVGKDGRMVQCFANGIADSLGDLFHAFGPPPYENPKRLRIVAKTTSSKRVTYKLELVLPALPTKKGK